MARLKEMYQSEIVDADVYMAQAAAISAIMMNTMEKVPH